MKIDNYFTIPCLWDEKKMQEIIDLECKNANKLVELYGAVPNEVIVTGRYNKVLDNMSKEKALDFKRKFVDKNGLQFAYLLNAPVDIEMIEEEKLENYLNWIINEFKANSITISSKSLLKKVRELFPSVDINISTIAGIKDKKTFEEFVEFAPKRVVLHHDCVKDIDALMQMKILCDRHNIIMELMVNESCINHCPSRKSHYNCLANNIDDHKFHERCNMEKILNPYNFLYANYIRPEDIKLYSEMGIHYFKITGRSKPVWWHKEVVKAYMEEKYDGNLIRLLGIDPNLEAEKIIYLDNHSLDGLAESLFENPDIQKSICKKKIAELYQNHAFYSMRENIEYSVVDKDLVCIKDGNDLYV